MCQHITDARLRLMLVPLLMLPIVVVALWLAFAPSAALPSVRWAVSLTTAAIVWYLIGGAIAFDMLVRRLRNGRALRKLVSELQPLEDPAWISDDEGRLLWRNAAASADVPEGGTVAAALKRRSVDPQALTASLMRRAGSSGSAAAPLGSGSLEVHRMSGATLCSWRMRPDAAAAARRSLPEDDPVRGEQVDALDALPVPLLRIGADGRVTALNTFATDLLGPVPSDATMATLFDGLGRPVEEWVDDVLNARTEARPEVLHRRGDGPDLYVQVTLGADARGGLVAVLSDASALKTLEAQFVQSQKMQAIGQLAGGIAHDFNNLLTAISGHVDLLMLRHDKSDPDYADLDQIRQNANRAAALVSQLLAFSRKQTLKPRLLDLRDTLADLMHLMNRLVGERIILNLEHDPALNPIRADARQFEQVIINLVVNARDAMPGGGCITIRTANVTQAGTTGRLNGSAARVDRPSLPKGRYVRITVSDEGCGIPQDQMAKIFEPFFTTKRTGEGTGLGLATVYGIVKQTGGYVFCDSTVGEGTCFSLFFPAHERAELASAARETAETPPVAPILATPQSGVVLLVEDEAPVRAFASRALALKGLEVLEADSAEAALSLLADIRREIDVFVTDVVMPGMDGPSWVRSALRDRPDTRVVFISGYTEDIFEDGREPVRDAVFLQKPFSLTALTDTVMAQIARRPASGPSRSGQAAGHDRR